MRKSFEIKGDDLRLKLDSSFDPENAVPYPVDIEVYNRINEILDYDSSGHIYISAKDNSDIQKILQDILYRRSANDDEIYWCYVYNFDEPNKPKLLMLSEYEKNNLENDIREITKVIKNEMTHFNNSMNFNDKITSIKNKFEEIYEGKIEDLRLIAKNMGFAMKVTCEDIYFTPIINDKKMNKEDYDDLTMDQQEVIKNRLLVMEAKAKIVKENIMQLKEDEEVEINIIKNERIKSSIKKLYENQISKRDYSLRIIELIKNIELDIIENIEYCFNLQNITNTIKINESMLIDEVVNSYKYKINVLNEKEWDKDQSYKFNIDYYELFGKIIYENKDNDYVTNHMLIEGGLLTTNNKRFVIINLKDLINNSLAYDKFKKCMLANELSFENIREKYGVIPIKSIEPEPIPIDMPIIIVGEHSLYRKLCDIDNEFYNLFNYNIKIEETINLNKENLNNFTAYLKSRGIEGANSTKILEWSIKESGSRNKISTNVKKLDKLINISKNIAFSNKNKISRHYIDIGKELISKNNNDYYKKINELLRNEIVLLDVQSKVIGQVNGLAVTEMVDCSVAMPIRITCTVGVGEGRIISIEDKSKVSGKIFNKGINIIRGYLNGLIFNEMDSGYECYVCFEQLYGMLEGDSAMLGIVVAIISAFSNYPVNQRIAVTGSMDQKGNVQPVGGVSDKIEGFYDSCKILGKNKKQGVIVPRRNYNDIILKEEVCKAIELGHFHIYLVDRVEDVVEILLEDEIDNIINNIYLHYNTI